jgi:hypothetical protein
MFRMWPWEKTWMSRRQCGSHSQAFVWPGEQTNAHNVVVLCVEPILLVHEQTPLGRVVPASAFPQTEQ